MHLHDIEYIPPSVRSSVRLSVSFAPSSSMSSLLFNQTTVKNELPTTLGYVFMLLLAWLLCSTSWIVPYESTAVCRQWDEALSMQKKNFGLSGLSRHLIFILRILFEWSYQGWNTFFCDLCNLLMAQFCALLSTYDLLQNSIQLHLKTKS
jgi:hypothetical protein